MEQEMNGDIEDRYYLVITHASYMLFKLDLYKEKGGWLHFDDSDFYGRVTRELHEFMEAVRSFHYRNGSLADVWQEAADVSNYLAMWCDKLGRGLGPQTERNEDPGSGDGPDQVGE